MTSNCLPSPAQAYTRHKCTLFCLTESSSFFSMGGYWWNIKSDLHVHALTAGVTILSPAATSTAFQSPSVRGHKCLHTGGQAGGVLSQDSNPAQVHILCWHFPRQTQLWVYHCATYTPVRGRTHDKFHPTYVRTSGRIYSYMVGPVIQRQSKDFVNLPNVCLEDFVSTLACHIISPAFRCKGLWANRWLATKDFVSKVRNLVGWVDGHARVHVKKVVVVVGWRCWCTIIVPFVPLTPSCLHVYLLLLEVEILLPEILAGSFLPAFIVGRMSHQFLLFPFSLSSFLPSLLLPPPTKIYIHFF